MHGYFDIGVNLTNSRFSDDVEQVIQRAQEVGVNGLLITGTSELESESALQLAKRYPDICYSTAGVHPHDAVSVSDDFLSVLRQLAGQAQVKAIGECGLDFNRNFSPPDKQIEVFGLQLELATELDLPVFLHERDAFQHQTRMLSQVQGLQGVAHCFTGTTEEMMAYLDLGLYVGITGWLCDAKRGQSLREAVLELPLERLLIETDAPFLTPKDLPGKIRRNEPCNLPHIAQAIADIKGIEAFEVADVSTHNAKYLFNL